MFHTLPNTKTLRVLGTTMWRALLIIVLAVSAGCTWGGREARVPRPESTRAPQPTFTPTALPPTATLPIPADMPTPTDTPLPPTDTPTPTPVPPTATPVPPTPTPLSPSPTFTAATSAVPAQTPSFELYSYSKENNCDDLGVYGAIFDAQGNPLPGITIEVIGSDDIFTSTSAIDGTYNLLLGPLPDYPDGATWYVQLKDKGQVVSDKLGWTTSRNCEDEDEIQVVHLEWKQKS